jgi:hypothetical protein
MAKLQTTKEWLDIEGPEQGKRANLLIEHYRSSKKNHPYVVTFDLPNSFTHIIDTVKNEYDGCFTLDGKLNVMMCFFTDYKNALAFYLTWC